MGADSAGQSAEALQARVRAAWAASPPDPDISAILGAETRANVDILVAAVVADAEEAAERDRPRSSEFYLSRFPELLRDGRHRRAVLMVEFSRLDASARAAAVARLVAFDRELRSDADRIDALCGAMEREPSLAAPAESASGQRVGKYLLVRPLGFGSFGEVWEARDTQLERYVALKFLRGEAVGGAEGLRRVLAEAQAAAALDHDHIVRVHAAGQIDEPPRSYIDSQLVGDPDPAPDDPRRVAVGSALDALTQHAPGGVLHPRRAAEIMSAVCAGVAAAHARGVLHRDLKPSNIIVTPSGRPLVADFGLSASVGGVAGVSVLRTVSGKVTGTPAFMAPEQARGEKATPLSDVYALGATLRFILTGRPLLRPSGQFSEDAAADILEQLRRLEDSGVDLPESLPRTLRAIVERAMAPSPADRYVSAQQMADDLNAWLRHAPTRARPLGPVESAGLWWRRHLAAVTMGAAALLILGAGAWRSFVVIGNERDNALQAQDVASARLKEVESARTAAENEARTSALVNEFLNDMLASADPARAGRDARIIDVLDSSAASIDGAFKDRPLVEAGVRTTLARAYLALGRHEAARPLVERAVALRTAEIGPDDPATLAVTTMRAEILLAEGRAKDAAAMLPEILAREEQILGPDHPSTLTTKHNLGVILWKAGRPADAEAVLRDVHERRARTLGSGSRETLASYGALAMAVRDTGRADEATAMLETTAADRKRVLGPLHPDTLEALNDLAIVKRMLGKVAEAEVLYRESIAAAEPVLGPDHPNTIMGISNLSVLLKEDNRLEEAEMLMRRVLDWRLARYGESHPETLTSFSNMGSLLTAKGDLAGAESFSERALEIRRRTLGPEDRATINSMSNLAAVYSKQGRFEEALALALEAEAAGHRTLPKTNLTLIVTKRSVGKAYLDLKRFGDAAPKLAEAYELAAQVMGPAHTRSRDIALLAAEAHEGMGNAEEAKVWREKAAAVEAPK